jgi:hypothetical protein
MLTASVRRKTLLVLLVAILVTPWASAASLHPVAPRSVQALGPAPLELFSRIWSFLRNAISDAGCDIDPNGGWTSQTPRPQTKAGCDIDPDGRCRSQNPLQTNIGCGIDPDGRCVP